VIVRKKLRDGWKTSAGSSLEKGGSVPNAISTLCKTYQKPEESKGKNLPQMMTCMLASTQYDKFHQSA